MRRATTSPSLLPSAVTLTVMICDLVGSTALSADSIRRTWAP